MPLDPMSRVRVVLVRPRVAGNVGAVARAMENFAAGQLVLVNPERPPTHREALERGTHGQHRLRAAQVVDTLEEALEGAVFAIGTSRRRGPVHQQRDYTTRDLGSLLAGSMAEGDVALLFGAEDNGLSREELLACDVTVQIPAWPGYPTLNLSHAVSICLYEMFLALHSETPSEPGAAPEPVAQARDTLDPVAPAGDQSPERKRGGGRARRSEPADLAMMERLMAKLQHALLTIGYLHRQKPDHLMFPIRAILSRAQLTRGEAQILMGLAQQIEEFAQYGGKKAMGQDHPERED